MSTINENMEKKIDLTQNDDYVMLGFFWLVVAAPTFQMKLEQKEKK